MQLTLWELIDNKYYFCQLFNSIYKLCYKLIVQSKVIWKKSRKSNFRALPSIKMLMKNTNEANYKISTTDVDLTISRIKLSLTLVEFKWEKVIILRLLLTPRAWRVVLVCPHSISVSVIIIYTNLAASSLVKFGFLKSKVDFCWIWTLSWTKG